MRTFSKLPNAPSFCAPPCMLDSDCPQNHQCIQSQCTPFEVRSCNDNQVIVNDACGRRLGLGETCSNGDYCRDGTCQAAAIGNICQTAVQITSESQNISGSMAQGISLLLSVVAVEKARSIYQFELEQDNRLIATARGFDTVHICALVVNLLMKLLALMTLVRLVAMALELTKD